MIDRSAGNEWFIAVNSKNGQKNELYATLFIAA